MTNTDTALAIADHHQRTETKSPTAFHHFGDAVDVDGLLNEVNLFGCLLG
jgi:hypothetical protein